jgi:hypothetical protein
MPRHEVHRDRWCLEQRYGDQVRRRSGSEVRVGPVPEFAALCCSGPYRTMYGEGVGSAAGECEESGS